MYEAGLLPAYSAGFIDLNKQYLTIGINGLNQAAEFLGLKCNDNGEYAQFCQIVFSTIKEQNALHNVEKGHKLTYNTECVPRYCGHIKPLLIDSKPLLNKGNEGQAITTMLCAA